MMDPMWSETFWSIF